MKLLALLLLIQPCYAQLAIANAADGSTTNFAPGSLILVAATSTPTLTIAPSTPVPVLNQVSEGIFLARLPESLPLGPATINDTSITILPSKFAIFTGPISAGLATFVSGLASLTSIIARPGPHFAQKNSGPQVGLTQPAHPGDYLTIYGTGLGNATPDQVSASLAGLPIPVTYAGPAPGEPGVDQINVFVPSGLAAPDSCYDAFSVNVAGTTTTPKALSYTASATTCPSPFGYTQDELAKLDAGYQVPYVQVSLQSEIRSATSSDNVGTGFTRSEFALAIGPFSGLPAPLNYADSVFYSCQPQPQIGALFSGLVGATQGLALTMGAASIPIGPGVPAPPLPSAVPTPDALPPSIFQPGTWQLTGSNFSQPIQIPPSIQLQNFSSLQSIDTTRDLTLTWNPGGYSTSDVFSLTLSKAACNARATSGSLTIPASLLSPGSATLTARVSVYPDATPNFRLPQPDGSTLPLQFTYSFSETFPVTVHP